MEAVKNHSQNAKHCIVLPEMAAALARLDECAWAAQFYGRRALRQFREHLWLLWCRLSSALRSFRGHIESQDARGFLCVNIGPAFRPCPPTGPYVPNERTSARSQYMQRLKAIYPWVDTVDLRLFLMGFDAGEQWAFRMGSEAEKLVEDTWLSSSGQKLYT